MKYNQMNAELMRNKKLRSNKWGQVFILAIEVVSFLTIYLWSNNATQDNQPLPSGYNFISSPLLLFLHFFLTAGSGLKPEPKHFGSIEDN